MEFAFDDNFSRCLEHLRSDKYGSATSELYPISKRTAKLEHASDGDVAQFARMISEVVMVLAEKVETDTGAEQFRHLITDSFRILRNSCGVTPRVQEQLAVGEQGRRLMQNIKCIADAVLKLFTGENLVQVLAVIIQFLYNFGIANEDNQDLVWDHFKGKLRLWLDMAKGETGLDQERAVKILNFASAVVEVCLPRQWMRRDGFLDDFESRDTMAGTMQAASTFGFDYAKKAMMKVVQVPDLLERMYSTLTPTERYMVNCCVISVVQEWRSSNEIGEVPTIHTNLKFLAETVVMSRPVITVGMLKAEMAGHDEDVQQHVKIVEVLAVASCCAAYGPVLRQLELKRESGPKTLIEYAIDLLCDVHAEGQKDYNMLTMVQAKGHVFCDHPAYLLRRDLVRFIGNLACRNKAAQDFVREFKGQRGLPVVIEQCVIDERNPFLAEWTKLALCCLVRENEESAKFFHGFRGELFDGNNILRTSGLVIEKDGNRFKIREEGPQLTASSLSDKEVARPN